jgi:hypothetical protein
MVAGGGDGLPPTLWLEALPCVARSRWRTGSPRFFGGQKAGARVQASGIRKGVARQALGAGESIEAGSSYNERTKYV